MRRSKPAIAVVGMACRFPKIDSLEELWRALLNAENKISRVPNDRWDPDRYFSADEVSKGKTYVRRGGFVNQDVKTFDASFFGISPREAESMDPQQRLLLEVVWEAFENCGLLLPEYSGRNVGVYVGGFMLDHMITQMAFANRSQINQHSAAGMMMTMLSNRISHTFNFCGPSLSIDTACSSSLVAFHVACQDIWRGACDMAVTGGANVMMRPEYPMGMCKGHFLSRDGESKSFDARGDGYGRGEGAGVVLLKPLSQAIENGDTILATVLGTGTNQDGRTPGISMPNGDAQQLLIEEVCRDHEVNPSDVDYVECHGTGTAIGDPTECRAIGATYGKGRTPDNPVVIGSIKSNIGHLEAAAGVAGVIKAVLTVMHRQSTPLGNLQERNAEIPFEDLGIRLSDAAIPLGHDDNPILVAVNSFGYGGSNAHVLMESPNVGVCEQAEPSPASSASSNGTSKLSKASPEAFPYALPVTGRSKESLNSNAANLATALRNTDLKMEDVIYTATRRRAFLNHRAVATGNDRQELIASLDAVATETEHENVVRDTQPFQGLELPVLVFTGMGPQWWYMGQQLYATQPLYKKSVEEANALFEEISGFSILAEMLKSEEESVIQETVYAQPANLLIQIGILELLKAAGVRPGLVVGHSVGELGAAYAAGALSLEDSLKVSYHRSQLQARTAGTGGMLAVGVGRDEAEELITPYAAVVSLAANNSPSTVTLAGDIPALEEIAERLTLEGTFNRMLDVEVPYHSPLMDALMPELEAAISDIEAKTPEIPLYSTVTGDCVQEPLFDAKYWPQNIRQPVEFEKAIRNILDSGFNTFVEVGPHPVLFSSLSDCIKAVGKECRLIHTLRRNLPDENRCVQRAAMSVFAAGCEIGWSPYVHSDKFVQLPNYAWNRSLFWSENDRAAQDRMNPIVYPILGTQEALAAPVWRNDFDHQNVNYLRDHVVSGMPILPAAAYVEALLELASIQFADVQGADVQGYVVRDIAILRPAIITPERGLDFTTTYDPQTRRAVQRSLENGQLGIGGEHLTANLGYVNKVVAEKVELDRLVEESKIVSDPTTFYQSLSQLGLHYGPYFQTVRELRQRKPGEIIAKIEIEPTLAHDLDRYFLHPTMLDGCLQSLMAMLDSSGTTFLPTNVGEFRYFVDEQPTPEKIWCIGRMVEQTSKALICDLTLLNESGQVIGSITGLQASAASRPDQRLDKYGDPVKLQILQYDWDYGPLPAEPKRLGHWLMIGDAGETSKVIAARLESFGGTVRGRVEFGDSYQNEGNHFTIAHDSAEEAQRVIEEVGDLDGVVFMAPIDTSLRHDCPTAQTALNAIITFTKGLLEIPVAQRPRAYVVTQGGFEIEDFECPIDAGSAAVNGWVRVANCELAGFRFSTIDLGDLDDEAELEALTLELICDMREDEVAIRGDLRFVSELRDSGVLTDDIVVPAYLTDDQPIKVRPLNDEGESVGTVRVLAAKADSPGEDEIVVRVEKSLLPKNLLQDQSSEEIAQSQIEFSGIVTSIGSNVHDLTVGASVCGFAPAELASHICGKRDKFFLAALPSDCDHASVVAGLGQQTATKLALQKIDISSGDRALVQCSPMAMVVAAEIIELGAKVTLVTDEPESIDEELRQTYSVCLACPESLQKLVNAEGEFDILVAKLSEWHPAFGFNYLKNGCNVIDTDDNAQHVVLPKRVGMISRTDLSTLLNRHRQAERQLVQSPMNS